MSPKRIAGDDHVDGVEFERNQLVIASDGATLVNPTGQRETVPAGLVLTSIGYRGLPVAGLPFDELTGTIPNDRGRVIDPRTGAAVPGAFVTGWIKRGPSGFIGTNKSCARETVEAIIEELNAGRLTSPPSEPRRPGHAQLRAVAGAPSPP